MIKLPKVLGTKGPGSISAFRTSQVGRDASAISSASAVSFDGTVWGSISEVKVKYE
jgi:hypothetical protein